MADSILPIKNPTPPLNTENVSGLISNKNPINTLSSIQKPRTFGDQLKDPIKQKIISSTTQSRLARLLKEKAALIKEGIKLEIDHNKYVNITLFNQKTPKKQIVNGQETDIPAEITEEEYQTALIIENGGVLPNGQQIKGNYPTAKENLDKRKKENQKQIDDFLKDPFAKIKKKQKELKNELKLRKQKSKKERRASIKAQTKTILRSAKAAARSLAPVIIMTVSNKVAEIIAQNDKIGKLVNDTNAIIEEANLSNNPTKLQNAKLSRDNAVRIITDNENKLRKINRDIQRISTYIGIFSTIVTIISAIPIPTAVPPGIGIPVNLIIKFVKILDRANRIVLILGSFIPSILMTLDRAIQILNDYKSRLLNINGFIETASITSSTPEDFLTPVQGTQSSSGVEFPEYKEFRFALREEDNPKFVVRGYKRRYAVAINKAGVEVLKSEYSFTLDPNDLIEQLKLLIDQRNLSASSTNPIGSNGSGTDAGIIRVEETGKTNTFLSPISPSTLSATQRSVSLQPPQPKEVVGPSKILKEKVPLSLGQKAKFAAILALPLPPPPATALAIATKADAAFILKENTEWQAAYKRYRKQVSRDVLKLES